MQKRYEVLILASPEITQDEIAALEKDMGKLVKQAKGTTLSFERWGKFRLSYPVRKKDYGVYFLTRVEAPKHSSLMDDVRTFFAIKMNEVVSRHIVTQLDPKGSLEYQRPKSLEESPTSRDVSSFLKENKMEGLLPSSERTAASTEEASELEQELKDTQDTDDATPSVVQSAE